MNTQVSETKKTATISVRLLPSERTQLIEMAKAEDRTLSQTIRRLLRLASGSPQMRTDYRLGR
jgi:hypothetical protein